MTRHALWSLLSLAVLVSFASGVARAQEAERTLYIVRNTSAVELAKVLGQLYKGDDTQILAEERSNALLIRAKPTMMKEITKLLSDLDRPPALVALEVLIVDVLVKESTDKPADGEVAGFDPKELSGPPERVEAKIKELQKSKQLAGVRRLQLTTPEKRLATILLGESKPMVTGAGRPFGGGAAGGPMTSTIQYRDVGLRVRATPRIVANGAIETDLDVEYSRIHTPDDGVLIATNPPTVASEVSSSMLKTTVHAPAGHTVMTTGVKTSGKAKHVQTLVFVTARVVDSGTGGGK